MRNAANTERSRCEEDLVGEVRVSKIQVLLRDRHSQITGKTHYGGPRDSRKDKLFARGEQLISSYQKHVRAGAFREVSSLVREQGPSLGNAVLHFHFRQNEVQIV